MLKPLEQVMEKRVQKTMESLRKNNMQPHFVKTKEEVPALVQQLLRDGDTVSMGGTQTLVECGVVDLLNSGRYNFLDRSVYKNGSEEQWLMYGKVFTADAYLTGTSALTEKGELYNVDRTGNRLAAIAFGPKSVIVIAGWNKLVKDIDEAVLRVKSVSAPANTTRMSSDTYCHHKGECVSLQSGKGHDICAGCGSEERHCSSYLICAHQMVKDRIKVIIVGEELGF